MKKTIILITTFFSLNIFSSEINNAIRDKKLEKIKELIKKDKSIVNKIDSHGETPLYWACVYNALKIVKLLINNGAQKSINQVNREGNTPLYWACYHNNPEMAKLLLKHSAKVNQVNRKGNTPLRWACVNKDTKMARLLVKHGAQVNHQANRKKIP